MGHLKENSKSMFSGLSIFGRVPDTDAGWYILYKTLVNEMVAGWAPGGYFKL